MDEHRSPRRDADLAREWPAFPGESGNFANGQPGVDTPTGSEPGEAAESQAAFEPPRRPGENEDEDDAGGDTPNAVAPAPEAP